MSFESGDKFEASGFQFEHTHLSTVVGYKPILAGRVKLELSVKGKEFGMGSVITLEASVCCTYLLI